jgi:hypothetical protein
MPYITPEDREVVDGLLGAFVPHDGGELQYAIAKLINLHYSRVQMVEGGVRYKHMEAIMGALSGALNEHYRCVVAPYEDKKIAENGGVYNVSTGSVY